MSEETTTQPETTETAPAAEQTSSTTWSVEDLQKELTKVRQEAGNYRIQAKTAAEEAAKTAQQEFTNKLAVALGLKEDAAVDPAALTASLTAAQSAAQQSARELAIFKAAGSAGADPNRLLDSSSFKSSIQGLDPSDGAAISAAITAAVAANPYLKAVQAAAASGTELSGTQETGQITEAELKRMSPDEIVAAQAKGLLRNLLS
jgi:hypothetical protein